jgi:hypothetical protein
MLAKVMCGYYFVTFLESLQVLFPMLITSKVTGTLSFHGGEDDNADFLGHNAAWTSVLKVEVVCSSKMLILQIHMMLLRLRPTSTQ